MEYAAPNYLTVQNWRNHEVKDFIQIFSIEILFFWCSPMQYELLFATTLLQFVQWYLIWSHLRYWQSTSMYITYTVWPVICYYSLTVWQWCLIWSRIRYWETSSMYLYMNLFLHRAVFSILTFLLKVDSSVGILSRKTFSYHFKISIPENDPTWQLLLITIFCDMY